ncbi:hypothetical protein [Alteromonas gilva]|uniref:Uncharacterized protein n=1 Tax=Alteromonas gilva TaxID=2987522 RepID=A0ABT5L5A5_9ALTE|nr:hypothetical protein [Alteromonas gilva]MDC8832225.1 hypothetical protein [Alteromonas gilva]
MKRSLINSCAMFAVIITLLNACKTTSEMPPELITKRAAETADQYQLRVLLEELKVATEKHNDVFDKYGAGSVELEKSHKRIHRINTHLNLFYEMQMIKQQAQDIKYLTDNAAELADIERRASIRRAKIENLESEISLINVRIDALGEQATIIEKQINMFSELQNVLHVESMSSNDSVSPSAIKTQIGESFKGSSDYLQKLQAEYKDLTEKQKESFEQLSKVSEKLYRIKTMIEDK